MVKDEDVLKVMVMPDVEGDEELEIDDSWDSIKNLMLCLFIHKSLLLHGHPWVYPKPGAPTMYLYPSVQVWVHCGYGCISMGALWIGVQV